MVFHKFDNLSSLFLHLLPQTTLWNLRWHTMPLEALLPPEKRRFLDIEAHDKFTWMSFVVYPVIFYCCWLAVYFCIHFVFIKDRIRTRNYDSMFKLYQAQTWSRNILYTFGKGKAAFMFVVIHFTFFLTCHICSYPCFFNYYWNTACILFWTMWSIWNGSCFYFNYFARRYEESLSQLQVVE